MKQRYSLLAAVSGLDTLWTVKQVARMFLLHTETIRRLIRQGILRAVKVGTSWRLPAGQFHDDLLVQQLTLRPRRG